MYTPRPNRNRLGAVVILAVLAVAIAACSSATGAPPSSSPVASPTPSPVASPTPVPSATPDSSPGQSGVKLDIADDHDVTVVLENVTGYPLKISSGRAGDGMSVRWHEAEIVNVDDSTLRVTWVGLPVDEQVKLVASFDDAAGGALLLTFKQEAPPANSDATGYDRVLILSFETPVSAEEVITAFEQAA